MAPLALIPISICCCEGALTVRAAVVELSLVALSIGPSQLALAMHLLIFPLTPVLGSAINLNLGKHVVVLVHDWFLGQVVCIHVSALIHCNVCVGDVCIA